MFVAQQRRDSQLPIVTTLLDELAAADGDDDFALRETLDRLIDATRRRFPGVASMSRTVRHRRFDRPHIDRARAEVSSTMRALATGLAGPTVDQDRLDELVASPLPLVPILAHEGLLAGTPTPGPLLEVLTRRYYKIRELGPITIDADGVVHAEYVHNDRRVHVIAIRAGDGALREALATAAEATAGVGVAGHGGRRRLPPVAGRPAGGRRRAVGRAGRRAAHRRPGRPGATRRAGRLPPRRADRRAHVPAGRRRRRAPVLDVGRARGGLVGRRPGPLRGGRQVPRAAPDDRPAAADVAPGQLRDQPAAGVGRGPPVRLRRPGEPVRRAARRRGRGARRHAGARRDGPGRRPARGREPARRPRSTPSARRWPSARTCSGWSGTGSCSTCGRPSTCRSTS